MGRIRAPAPGWPAVERREADGEMIRRRFPGAGRHLLSIETKTANGYVVDRSATLTDPAANKGSAKVALDMDDDFVFDVSPDGKTLLVFNLNRPPRLVDAATGKTTRMLIGHKNYVSCGAFSPDGRRVATASGTTRRSHWIPKTTPPAGTPTEIILWDAATGKRVAALRDRTVVHADDAVGKRAARVMIELADGRVLDCDVEANTGTPANPLSDADLADKFTDNAAPRLGDGRAAELLARCWALEAIDDFGAVVRMTGVPA